MRNKAYQKYFKAKNMIVAEHVMIKPSHKNKDSKITFGDSVVIDREVLIDYTFEVNIGNNVTISEGAKIYTHNHSIDDQLDIQYSHIKGDKLQISDYTWIGSNAIILPSVKYIGKGAIIAAGAVVTKEVKPYEVVAGNPAKKIKTRNIDQ